MSIVTLPYTIKQGYPEKIFTFSGEWEKLTLGSRQTKSKNKRTVFVPVYVCMYERSLPMWLAQKQIPEKTEFTVE